MNCLNRWTFPHDLRDRVSILLVNREYILMTILSSFLGLASYGSLHPSDQGGHSRTSTPASALAVLAPQGRAAS